MIRKIILKLIGSQNLNKLNQKTSFLYKSKFIKYKNKRKIFYCSTPIHGNMGDQAIALATYKFLQKNYPTYEIIEVEKDQIYKYIKAIKESINKDDLIFIHGGGNMGNWYPDEEYARRLIIETFKENKIISMTQTICFSNDESGKQELEKTKRIYNSHPNLTLLARENKSYEIMKKIFNCKVLLVPDIVFSLEGLLESTEKRVNIMTCLRGDRESYWGSKSKIFLNDLKSKYDNVFEYDTVIPDIVRANVREGKLNEMWSKFFSSKLVITDRLHGMIFAFITKTPCIVLRSADNKVIESYSWIKDVNYIRYVESIDLNKISAIIDELLNIKVEENSKFNSKYFENLSSEF